MKKGWEYKNFTKCLKKVPKQPQIKSKDYKTVGVFPIVSQEAELISGYCDNENFVYRHNKPIIIFGDHTKNIKYIDFDFITGADGTHILYPIDSIDSKYFYYVLKSIKLRNLGYARHFKLLKEKDIPIPPLSEQKEIVEYLDSSFAKIDKLKENAAKNLEEAKALFQSALKDALEPKEGWEEKILKDICTHIVDCPHSTPPKSDTPTEYPFIRTSDLKQGKISWDVMQYVSKEEYHKRNARITPQKNDIIYGREGTFGDAALLPEYPYFCLGQRVVLLRSNIEIVNPEFLLYTVISPFVYSQAKNKNMGCGVGHVNVADIKRFKMFIPPLSEQQEIVSRLDSLNEKVNTLQQNYSRICSECDALKQAILRQVFE